MYTCYFFWPLFLRFGILTHLVVRVPKDRRDAGLAEAGPHRVSRRVERALLGCFPQDVARLLPSIAFNISAVLSEVRINWHIESI